MELSEIIMIVTMIVTWLLGIIAKKLPWFKNNLIPVQNIAVGVIVAIIEWIVTKNFNTAIAMSGLLAGGIYDVFSNLKKIFEK